MSKKNRRKATDTAITPFVNLYNEVMKGKVSSYRVGLSDIGTVQSPQTTKPGPYDGREALKVQHRALKAGLKTIGLEALSLQFDGDFIAHFCVRDPRGRLSEVHLSTPDVRHEEFEAHMKTVRSRRAYRQPAKTRPFDMKAYLGKPLSTKDKAGWEGWPDTTLEPYSSSDPALIAFDEAVDMDEATWQGMAGQLKGWDPEETRLILEDLERYGAEDDGGE